MEDNTQIDIPESTWWARLKTHRVTLLWALAMGLLLWGALALWPTATPAPVPDTAGADQPIDMQDQIDTLRLRVAVLEAQQPEPPAPAQVPIRSAVPRPAPRAAAPPEPVAEAAAPPPITRQSIDQYRASLRTDQPQE